MPPDVFLVLASSGLTLVASLLFFVSEDVPPPDLDDARAWVSFCLPPRRARARPPPLPPSRECEVAVSTGSFHGVMTLRPQGDDWVVTLETSPVDDAPTAQARKGEGAVHDLRWHGEAGVVRSTKRSWRQKPGRA